MRAATSHFDLNKKLKKNLSRYLLLRDMVKDARHHPDYKVCTKWHPCQADQADPPGILSRGDCFKRIVNAEERSCHPWNSADSFECKRHLSEKMEKSQKIPVCQKIPVADILALTSFAMIMVWHLENRFIYCIVLWYLTVWLIGKFAFSTAFKTKLFFV